MRFVQGVIIANWKMYLIQHYYNWYPASVQISLFVANMFFYSWFVQIRIQTSQDT